MNLTVEDGMPYADGKRVIFACNKCMNSELELAYISQVFTNIKWMLRLETEIEEYFYVPPFTTLHDDYMDAIEEVTVLLSNYKSPDTKVGKLWVMADTEDTIVFMCDETEISGRYVFE